MSHLKKVGRLTLHFGNAEQNTLQYAGHENHD